MEWQNLPAPCLPKVRPWSPPLIPPSETWHETAGLMDGATRVSHDQLMNVSAFHMLDVFVASGTKFSSTSLPSIGSRCAEGVW